MDSGDISQKAARAGELAAAVLVFWLFGIELAPLSSVPVVGELLNIVGGLAFAVLVPMLIFGLPTAHVTWQLGNDTPFRDNHELNFELQPEITCDLDVTVNYSSLLGLLILERAVRQGTSIRVTFRPDGKIRVKEQLATGGAVVDMDEHSILLPLTNAERNGKQSCWARFSFLANHRFSGTAKVQVSTKSTSVRGGQVVKRSFLSVKSDVHTLPVRN